MLKLRYLKRGLVPIALGLAMTGAARADFNPVVLTPGSYTFDIVVEKETPLALPYCINATQGGGTGMGDTTWFEQGFWRSPNQNIGVPHPGQTFTHQSNPNITYVMPSDYLTNNGLLIDAGVPYGTLTLSTPTTCSGLSLFGSSGGGNGTVDYVVTHADDTTETGSFTYNDWFNGANPAWTAGGRIPPGGGPQNNGANPRLYSAELTVSSASPVVSLSFTWNTGGHIGIYAVSATTDGTVYTPVAVDGFDQKMIVPAAFPVTATMDQGTNTVDNGNLATWFEAGYNPTNSSFGLPLSGSTFDSQSQPTHHYQMASYTGNNAILIDANHLSANITPASPAPYNAFALLTAGGNIGGGPKMTNYCIMEHADGINETNVFIGYDWFEGSVPGFVAYVSNGRVNMHDRTLNALGSGNPKLFETYFQLTDGSSPVTNIVLRYGTSPSPNSTTFVMAISATAGGVPPVIAGQPQWLNAYPGSTAQFAVGLGSGTAPVTYSWQKAADPAGPFSTLSDGGNVSGSATATLSLANISAADGAYYRAVVTNAVGTDTSAAVALYLLTSTLTNITLTHDPISDASFLNTPPPNGGEGVSSVVDHTTAKYLCFGLGGTGAAPFTGPSGFVLTPGIGNTIVSALRIYAANDAPVRDPADIMLEGSNDDGSTWTTILADTPISMPDARNNGGLALNLTNQVLREIDFPNTTGYKSYKVTINNVKDNSTAIGMQVAEVEFLGIASGPPVVIAPFSLVETNLAVLGGTANLSVGVGGTPPFTFQWTVNGANLTDDSRITGSQSNVLRITDVQLTDAGYYQLFITNAQGFYNVYPGGGADQYLYVVTVPTLFTNGVGWATSASPAAAAPMIDNGVLTLTVGAGGTARSAFFASPLDITAFETTFTYQDVGGGGADGFTFCLQNDPRGTSALGGGGGALAVNGITPSAELTFNIYGTSGISFGENGANGSPYHSTSPVDIASGDPIAIKAIYANGAVTLTLSNTTTAATFTTNFSVGDLPTVLGGPTAYVGFTGADGGIASTQTISDFAYVPTPSLAAHVSGSNLVLTWPLSASGYGLQSAPDLTSGNWQNVTATVTQVGGQNQVSIPLAAGNHFYRLVIALPVQ